MDLGERDLANPHRHPWEISRRRCLLKLVSREAAGKKLADIGAGDLYFSAALSQIAAPPVLAVDPAWPAEAAASPGIQMWRDAAQLAPGSLQGIFLLDVLEHLEREGPMLEQLHRALLPGGFLLVSVPACPALFSAHDRALGHRRRYRKGELQRRLTDGGFKVERIFYFYSSLLLLRLCQLPRWYFRPQAAAGVVARWRRGERHWLTRLLVALLDLDFFCHRFFSQLRLDCPGLSLCALCRKK